MSEDVSAGRLFVDVVADTAGLRDDLRAKLEAVSRDLKATVTVNLKVTADQAKAQIDRVAKDRTVKLSVRADTAPAREDIDMVSADRTVTIKAKASTGEASAGLDAAARDRTATIKAKADTSTLGAEIEKIGAKVATASQFTAMGAGLLEAAGAAGNLAGALVAVVAAAGQAAGLIGVLPGLLAAAGQGAGVVMLGMSGIGKAVGALTTAQQAAGASAGASALAQMQAADQVRSAQQGLANAQIQAAESVASAQHGVRQATLAVADAQYNAAQSVASSLHTVQQDVTAVSDAQYNAIQSVTQAEHSLTDAEYSEQQAQLALTQAREAARQNLLQTAFDLRGAVIGEAQAALSLTEAKTRLEQTLQSSAATDQQKQQAQLDLQQAQLAYDESVNKAGQAQVAKAKADKAGVDGSQQVVQARHGESDAAFALQQSEDALARARVEAARSVASAQYELSQARQSAARAQVMAIRSVQDAEYAQGQAVQALADAQRTAAQSVASAQRAYTEAMLAAAQPTAGMTSQAIALRQALIGLSPAGRAFAEMIATQVIPRYRQMQKAVQGAFLPGLQAGVQSALPLLGTLQAGLTLTGTVMGGLAAKFGAFLGSPGTQSDLAMIMRVNAGAIGVFGDAGLHAADALRNIMVAAEPLIPRIASLADHLATLIDNATRAGRASGGLAGFFDKAWQSAMTLGRIAVDLGVTLGHVLGAAAPAGGTLLSSLADATDRLRAWTADPANQQRMQAFFTNAIPLARQVGDALVRIAGILLKLSSDMGGGQYNVIFSALGIILSILTDITKIPGLGTAVNYILALALAGIGLGRVASNITTIGKGLAAIAKFTGLKDLLATVTGGAKTAGATAASTAVETAATAMQAAADTMVTAAAAMQRAADTMVGADAAGAGTGAGGAAAKGVTAAETTAEGTAIGAGIGSKLLGAGIIAAIALAIVEIGIKPLLKGQSSGTQQDSTRPGNWWDNPGGSNPVDPRTAGQGFSTWAGAGTAVKGWLGFGQSTPSTMATPNNRGAAPAGAPISIDPNVGEMAWTKWWQGFDQHFIHKITNWFTQSLPHLFTSTIPHAADTSWDTLWRNTITRATRGAHDVAAIFDGMRHQVAVIFDGARHETAHVWDDIYGNTVGTVIRLGKDAIDHLKSGLITPAENGLKTAWNWITANVATPIATFFTRTLPGYWNTAVGFLKTKFITPVENGLKTAWNWVVSNVGAPIGTFFTRTLAGYWNTAIGALNSQFVTPFENAIKGAWNWVVSNVFNPLGNFVTRTLPGYFTSAVGQIKSIWSGIESAFSGPVKIVVNNVLNPLIGDVDTVLSFVSLPQIKKVPGFAGGTGGAPPGWAWVGEQGRELMWMKGGEHVLPHPLSERLAGAATFPGYASGTPPPASGNPGGLGGVFGHVTGAISGALNWAKNLALGALAATFQPVADALLNLMPKPQSGAESMIEALPRMIVTDLISYIKSKDPGAGVGGGSGADVANYAKTFATGLSHPYVLGGASPNGWDCCLVAGTLIHGPGGATPIADIRAGDLVWSWEDGRRTTRAVLRQWKSKHQPVFTVRTRNQAVTASANHPFLRLTPVTGAWAAEWARLDQLRPGDLLVQPRPPASGELPRMDSIPFGEGLCIDCGQPLLSHVIDAGGHVGDCPDAAGEDIAVPGAASPDFTVTPLLTITPAGEQDTWDVEIEESHCFIADGLVVHNSGFAAWVYEKFGYFPEKQGSRHGTSESQFADPLLQSSGADTGALAFFDDGVFANPGHVGVVLNPAAHVSASGTAVGTVVGSNAGAVGYRIPKGGFKAAGTGSGGIPTGTGATVKALMQSMAASIGWTGLEWTDLDHLEMQEAGYDVNATNPSSGAYGLAQGITGPSWYYQWPGGSPLTAAGQIRGMFAYIRCMPLDSRILTRYGWKTCDEVQVGDETVGYDALTGNSAWTKVTAVHRYDAAPVTRLSSNRVDLRSTPNHRWLTEKNMQPGKGLPPYRREMFTETQHIGSRHRIRLAVPHDDLDGLPISLAEAELLGWVAGDGCVHHLGPQRRYITMTVIQSKPGNIERIRSLFAGIPHSEYQRADIEAPATRADGKVIQPRHVRVTWRFSSSCARDLLERSGYEAGLDAMVIAMSSEQRTAFIAGLLGADGYLDKKGTWTFCQNDGPVLRAFMLAAYLSGHWCHSIDSAGQKHVRLGSPYVGGGTGFRREDLGLEPVWCVTTDLGSWTVEQSGQIFLTGNSRYGDPIAAWAHEVSNNWYDQGGPLHPGVTTVVNATGRDEWVLNPQAVDLLGGAQAVAQLNMAARTHAAATGIPLPAAGAQGTGRPGSATVNVFPQPRQSPEEIGAIAVRKLGMMMA